MTAAYVSVISSCGSRFRKIIVLCFDDTVIPVAVYRSVSCRMALDKFLSKNPVYKDKGFLDSFILEERNIPPPDEPEKLSFLDMLKAWLKQE